jgi:hypothetical protein
MPPNQTNEDFIFADGACATSASFAAFECDHLVHVADVKHGRCRSHGHETDLSLDDRIL